VDVDVFGTQVQGKVLLYDNRDEGASPYTVLTHKTTTHLPDILMSLASKYSPIKSMSDSLKMCTFLMIYNRPTKPNFCEGEIWLGSQRKVGNGSW
jgi:hypothetical protein